MAQIFTEEEVKEIFKDMILHAKVETKVTELLYDKSYRDRLFNSLIKMKDYHINTNRIDLYDNNKKS